MLSEPQREHRWLEQLVGEWTLEMECSMGPDQPPSKSRGVEVVRSLGGHWVIAEGEGENPGGPPMKSIMTLGFDPRSNRYVGTFVSSMMAHLWVYNGSLDAAEEVLSLETEGPDFTSQKLVKYVDAIEIIDANHRVMTSRIQGDDGNWTQIVTVHYHRKK